MRRSILSFIALVAGCQSTTSDGTATGGPGGPRPDAREGYRRFEARPMSLAPGRSAMTVEWVAAPADRDLDVLDISGWQSAAGHHAVLYATADEQPVGTVRNWQNEDQLSARFIGGSGGEAAAQIKLPPGVVTRIPRGYGLVLQVHYLNTSPVQVMGESFVDVKLADASPGHRVASFFTSTSVRYELPPGAKTSLDIDCKLKTDVPLLMFANHQHEMGVSVVTEQVRPDGTRSDVKRDDRWQDEWAFNPNFTSRPIDSPLTLNAGNTLHTHCEWMNTSSRPVRFPDEMCVFLGFFLGDEDINCVTSGRVQ
jgi:hypothetical protein